MRLVLCRAGGMRLRRIRRPSGGGVSDFTYQLLAPNSWLQVFEFQIFEVLVPLQKSSPAPPGPASPPPKWFADFFQRPKNCEPVHMNAQRLVDQSCEVQGQSSLSGGLIRCQSGLSGGRSEWFVR